MAKYNWDIDELRARRGILEQKLAEYEELYNLYSTLIENYDIRGFSDENDEYEKLGTEIISFKNLRKEYENIDQQKRSLINGAVNIVTPFDAKIEQPILQTIPMNNDELIASTRVLFEKLPDQSFLQKFDKFTKQDNNQLHMKYYQKLPTECLGLAYIDSQTHRPYGLVARYNTIQDVITLGHEIFHMAIRENEIPLFLETNKTVYFETEGYFAQLLLVDLLNNLGHDIEELYKIEKRDLTANIDIIKTNFVINQGFKLMNDKNQINFRKLNTILKQNNISTTFSKRNFPILLENIDEDINYSTSYLTALDLFNIYKKDTEKALYYLKQIPLLNGDNPKEELSNIDVHFFEDGYKNLNNQCKKLLKTKTTSQKK